MGGLARQTDRQTGRERQTDRQPPPTTTDRHPRRLLENLGSEKHFYAPGYYGAPVAKPASAAFCHFVLDLVFLARGATKTRETW